MPLFVKKNKAANPLNVGFFGAVRVVIHTNGITNLIQQFLGRWLTRLHRVDKLFTIQARN
uniref:Uncharacterized protein n=1 Tax=Desertifilum tharense IPPAS B-1220 TaxID=1781255 RepID=A0A1E5QDF4_9CYAN|nr:hypothetical protein BH720_24490 [Desertifilum tharense IPPAS B-1220]